MVVVGMVRGPRALFFSLLLLSPPPNPSLTPSKLQAPCSQWSRKGMGDGAAKDLYNR